MPATIAICIPTINRVDYLRQLISALLPQTMAHGCEIHISDNASSDGTPEYLRTLTGVHAHRHDTRIPLDENHRFVSQMASGGHCDHVLLLGDDDFIPEGGLRQLLAEVDRAKPDLLVLNGWHTDADLLPQRRHLADGFLGLQFPYDTAAFRALAFSMPFGSFLARKELLEPGNWQPYMGTKHAYSAAVWHGIDSLQRPARICTGEAPVVLLRGAQKTWQSDSARIHLVDVPKWFLLLKRHLRIRDACDEHMRLWMANSAGNLNLLRFKAEGQLTQALYDDMTDLAVYSDPDQGRVKAIMDLPMATFENYVEMLSVAAEAKRLDREAAQRPLT